MRPYAFFATNQKESQGKFGSEGLLGPFIQPSSAFDKLPVVAPTGECNFSRPL